MPAITGVVNERMQLYIDNHIKGDYHQVESISQGVQLATRHTTRWFGAGSRHSNQNP